LLQLFSNERVLVI